MKKVVAIIASIIIIGSGTWLFSEWRKNNQPKVDIDSSLKVVQERGSLIVGADAPYGVMEFFDQNGQIIGMDVDVAQAIASGLKVDLEFKKYAWDNLFDAVKKGEIDLALSSITITPERSQEILFSSPYFSGGQAILARSGDYSIKKLSDLAGKKIGVQIETTGQTEARKINPDELIITYAGYGNGEKDIISDLKNGTIDAVIADYVQVAKNAYDDPELKIVGAPFTQEYYGAATNLNNISLMTAVDNIIREMKRDGRLSQIETKWIKK